MSLKRLFGSKKKLPVPDLSVIGVDMHSHLIPGIDDGVKSVEESLALIRQFEKMGYTRLITTPHINNRYPNNTELIRSGLKTMQQAISDAGLSIQLHAGAEYLLEDGCERFISEPDLMTFSGKKLLIELSYFIPHPNLSSIIYELQIAGYELILAHAERYGFWHHDLKQFESFLNRDVALQVNMSSLSGYYGSEVRNAARKFIERGWISYAGSDVHNQMYMNNFIKGTRDKYALQLIHSGLLKNALL